LNGYVKAAIAGEIVLFVALAVLIVTGVVPSADVTSAVAIALVGGVFGLPAWAWRSSRISERTEQQPAPNPVKIDDSEDAPTQGPEAIEFLPKMKMIADEETIVIKHREVENYRVTINSKWRLEGKIASSIPIDIYIMSADEFRRFMNRRRFYADQEREGVKQSKISFQPPRKDEWCVVLDNDSKEDAEVTVSIKAIQLAP